MKKLNAKSIVLIVIICLIAILLLSLVLISNLGKDKEKVTTTTTTTTEKIIEELSFTDEISNISLDLKNNNNLNKAMKLVVEKLENINTIKNLVAIYDIKFVDETNNIIDIKENEINISIPYDNSLNYKGFNVLYLSDTNEILETIPATYENGFVKFKTTHLSKYAIEGIKEEEPTTTVKPTTTKKVDVPTTTKKVETPTQKPTEKPTTTKKVETTKPTTKPTTQPTTKPVVKTYVVKVSPVDQYSPDRVLSVYENGTPISVSAIKYNGSTLCNGSNMVVNMFEIEGISSVTVVLKDGTSVTATVQ